MSRFRIAVLSTILPLLVALAGASAAHATYPNSMASMGDSITRAFQDCSIGFSDCPAESWSTGTDSKVNSHYTRILAKNAAISGHNTNDAVSGAKVADTNNQAKNVVGTGAQYVTILIGANDACTSSESTMTSVSSFQSSFQSTMSTLESGLPASKIFVGSVPDVYQLWSLFHTNSTAVNTWNLYGICQSMLANATSTAQADVDRRAAVRQRVIDFNTALQNVCSQYSNCKFDNNAVFNYQFKTTDVSTRDYFHPSIAGQTNLASTTWGATWAF